MFCVLCLSSFIPFIFLAPPCFLFRICIRLFASVSACMSTPVLVLAARSTLWRRSDGCACRRTLIWPRCHFLPHIPLRLYHHCHPLPLRLRSIISSTSHSSSPFTVTIGPGRGSSRFGNVAPSFRRYGLSRLAWNVGKMDIVLGRSRV